MAVIKIMSPKDKYKDDMTYHSTIQYSLNPRKALHGYYFGYGVNVLQADLEMDILSQAYGKKSGTKIRHMILSFDPNETDDIDLVFFISKQIAAFYGDQYQIIGVVHENQPNLHTHFIMNTVSYIDGKKYNGQKKEFYQFIKYATNILRQHNMHLQLEKE